MTDTQTPLYDPESLASRDLAIKAFVEDGVVPDNDTDALIVSAATGKDVTADFSTATVDDVPLAELVPLIEEKVGTVAAEAAPEAPEASTDAPADDAPKTAHKATKGA